MSNLTLDGNISYIGTEFIKLLNTGSSHLATEEYVDNAVGNGGGGSGDGYTQAEVDALLNNKLNVNNPQDITGNLRLDPTNGNSKIIINAVSPPNASDDFYCNGNGHFNGTLRVSVLTSDGDVNCDGVNADVFNSNVITNDIIFNHNDVEYMRFNATDDEIQLSKNIELNEDLIMKSTKVLYLDATSNLLRYITTRNDNGQDILELVNNKATNNQIRFTNNGSTSLIVDNSFLFSERQIQGNNGLKVDFLDTRTASANFDFRRNNVSYITFQSNRVDINQPLHLSNALTIDVADKLTMRPSLEGGVNIFDIRNLHPIVDNPMIRFRVGEGNGTTIVCEMTNNAVSFQRNVIVGTAYELRTNAIDTVNDSPLIFNRNDNEIMRFQTYTDVNSGNETYPLINVEATARLSCNHVYITHILNRAGQFDNTFQGSNAAGTARVEYMRWNYADQSLDFNAPIDNTNIAVIGNIVDTTVSDERLKTNIQDVESNYCDCVKNVKIKTFEYKDEKYKDSDKYGFIAQHLQKHLPKEFDNIVKETKPKKDEGEAYLSINYMKLSVVLWGALQETLTKVEHLESRLFQLEAIMLEDIINERRGKGKGEKTKPKAKSKQLSRSESSLGRSPKPEK